MKLQFSRTRDPELLRQAMGLLEHTLVQVGIPEENDHHSGPFSASGLLALHEAGSPINRMPPRPVLKPALSEGKTVDAMTACLREALQRAMEGDVAGTRAALEKTGETGVAALKAYVSSGAHLTPNAPMTFSGGWMRNRKSGKPVKVQGKGSGVPLIRTGELVQAFGYKLKGK